MDRSRASELDIGQKLRAIRRQKGLSLRDLAARAEVSASLLSQIENGKANPSVRSLYNISGALEVPVDYFFPSDSFDRPREKRPARLIDQTVSDFLATTFEDGDGPFLDTEPPPAPVVRRGDRSAIELLGGVRWERLTPGPEEGAEYLEITYEPGATSGKRMSHHIGREFGVVLEGELLVELAFEQYLLRPGDSIIFDSSTPHRLTNRGNLPMRAIWVILGRN